jgi:DNA-binding XRE family transcriptional regulator
MKSGLSQNELANILGSCSGAAVSRHERSKSVPDLLTAFGYEAIFQVPISDLFPGIYQTVAIGIEGRLATMEHELHQKIAKGKEAVLIAQKLEFLSERKSLDSNHPAT